jgi:hypothetical protein
MSRAKKQTYGAVSLSTLQNSPKEETLIAVGVHSEVNPADVIEDIKPAPKRVRVRVRKSKADSKADGKADGKIDEKDDVKVEEKKPSRTKKKTEERCSLSQKSFPVIEEEKEEKEEIKDTKGKRTSMSRKSPASRRSPVSRRSPSPKTDASKRSPASRRSPKRKAVKKEVVNDESSLSLKPINAVEPVKAPVVIKKTKEVLYDLLFEAANLITDEFWKNYFLDLSKGKCKKIYVDATTVSYTFKRNSFTYVYKDKTPEEISLELKRIINNTMLIFSDTDMVSEEQEIRVIANEFSDAKKEDNWKKIKNRKMKDNLITRFIIDTKQEKGLTWEEARRAYNVINNALFVFYTHNSDDISMKNGDMVDIDDIVISKKEIHNLRLDSADTSSDKPAVKKINLDKEWTKCVTNIYKSMSNMLAKDSVPSASKALSDAKKRKRNKKAEEEKKAEVEDEIVDEDEEYAFEPVEVDETTQHINDGEDYLKDSDEEVDDESDEE